MMESKNISRILGIAFLLQFATTLISGMLIEPALVVPGNIVETMINIADKTWLMRTYILVDMLTAMGIIFLGSMLYVTLKKQHQTMALVALGLYILEATLLAGSKLAAFWLLRMSEEFVVTGQPAYLQTLGNMALESMEFVGMLLHLLVFCLGAILFYTLLYQSREIPRLLSLWGLVTLLPILYGTIAAILGYEVSEVVYFPYFPFEFVVGLWILVKGFNIQQHDITAMEPALAEQ